MLNNKIRRLSLYLSKELYWFTLVELIVVITILWILWAVWFLSFQGQNIKARDSSRASDLSNITKSLSVFQTERWILPKPTESIDVAAAWVVIWYQWKAWDSVLEQIKYNEWWMDPLDWKPYTYFANKNWTKYQLMWFYEDKESWWKVSETSTWWYAWRFPTLAGDNLWVMFSPVYHQPVHEVPYFASTWSIDVATTTWTFQSYIADDFIIQWSSSVLNIIENIASPTALSTPFPTNCSEVMSSGQFAWNGQYVVSTDWWTT